MNTEDILFVGMKRKESRVEITQEILQRILSLKERTGIGALRLFRFIIKNNLLPPGSKLTNGIIEQWMLGNVKTANREDLKAVQSAYNLLLSPENAEQCGINVTISKQLRSSLAQYLDKSKYARQALLMRHDCPNGLNSNKLTSIITGRQKYARPDHIRFLNQVISENIDGI